LTPIAVGTKALVRRLSQAPQCIADGGCVMASRDAARHVALGHHDVEDLEKVEVQRSEVRRRAFMCGSQSRCGECPDFEWQLVQSR
jgi:hypothetical protein